MDAITLEQGTRRLYAGQVAVNALRPARGIGRPPKYPPPTPSIPQCRTALRSLADASAPAR